MSALVLLQLLAVAADDACSSVDAATARDPKTAGAYLQVGQEELAAGQAQSAAAAFRRALALDPSSHPAREGLERLCPEGSAQDAFSQAVALMNAGDRRGAIERFEALRRDQANPGAALLEGISAYELGDDERARALLLEARQTPELSSSADLFLGLIALGEGEASQADERFAEVLRRDTALRGTAGDLLKLSAQAGKLVVTAQLFGGYDSNVELAPSTAAAPSGVGDASLAVAASAVLRPLGQSGPYARVNGSYEKQLELAAYDTGAAAATAGWQLSRGDARASADYAFEFLAFGGAPYLLTHALGLRGHLGLGPFALEAEYSARFQGFLGSATAGYSGTLHSARLGVGFCPNGRSRLAARYLVDRDLTALPELAFWAHGPEVSGSVQLTDELRLIASIDYQHRRHDAVDPDFELVRTDERFDASARLEVDLGRYVTLFLAVEARAVLSNVEDLTYTRVVGWVGGAFSARVL